MGTVQESGVFSRRCRVEAKFQSWKADLQIPLFTTDVSPTTKTHHERIYTSEGESCYNTVETGNKHRISISGSSLWCWTVYCMCSGT